jgi:PAS domain S-box-containing protein
MTTRLDQPGAPDILAKATLRWFRDHAAHGIFVTDAALRVQSWNEWLVEATGITAGEVMGQPLFDVFPSFVERGFDQYFAEALNGHVKILSHSLHRFILPVDRVSGQPMPQSGRIAPLMADGLVVGTITLVEDVTERVATERELRARIAAAEKARATAEAASRVKDEFLATLSHEIRTPLNAVLGWTRILRAREPDQATVRRAVDVIDRNASAQLTLISDMLDMARIASGKVRLDVAEVDMAGIALSAIDVVRPAADAKSVRLVTDIAPQVPPVSGDPDRLLQVAWNLLSNAVKFTDAGGSVTVRLNLEGGRVCLSVADTGQGIDPEFLPHVFERFKQADPSSARRHGGLGLGLALVRELVELHGGNVSVDSAGIGLGAKFSVTLPPRSVAMAVGPREAMPGVDRVASLAGVHVLVVEDDADAREIVARTVTDAGAQVTAASSAPEAMAFLSGVEPAAWPDVIVTDIGLPDTDGYALLEDVRQLAPERGSRIPVIAVTAYATASERRKALERGFDAHLAKPFAPLTLVSTIARSVARK